MLTIDQTVLILVDVQGNLAQAMHNKEDLFKSIKNIISGCRVLDIPIVWAEQIPEKLGPTLPDIASLLTGLSPIAKCAFSCFQDSGIRQALTDTGRTQVLLAGIEAHVCIYQTAMDLVGRDYTVEVVADAVSSRTPENKKISLKKMRDAGVAMTSVEMALMELLGGAEAPKFREIINIIK